MTSLADTLTNAHPAASAAAAASSLLPVPGGPNSRMPRHGLRSPWNKLRLGQGQQHRLRERALDVVQAHDARERVGSGGGRSRGLWW